MSSITFPHASKARKASAKAHIEVTITERPAAEMNVGMKGAINLAAAMRNGETLPSTAMDTGKLDIVARRAEIETRLDMSALVEALFADGEWEKRPNGPVFRSNGLFVNVETDHWIDFDDERCWSACGVVELIAHMKGVDIDEATEIAERLYSVLAPNHIAHDGKSYIQWPAFSKAA